MECKKSSPEASGEIRPLRSFWRTWSGMCSSIGVLVTYEANWVVSADVLVCCVAGLGWRLRISGTGTDTRALA